MPVLMLPKGIHCPICKGTNFVPKSWNRPTAGLRVRYFKCLTCDTRFKSQERVVGTTKKPWNGKRADGSAST